MLALPRGFALPKTIHWDRRSLSRTYGKGVIQPFERGYALIIGNAFRRVLLSSIEGAAVTSVRIAGALHEFCSLRGVVEDVSEIILNIKAIRFRLHGEQPKMLYLKALGEGEVRAAQINPDPDVEILNPDLYIATLDRDGSLEIEMEVRRGRGYVAAERNRREGMPIGVIPVDSLFSPVKKVIYRVEPLRPGDTSGREKLLIELWTDGGVGPQEALREAAAILTDQLDVFLGLEEAETIEEEKADEIRRRLSVSLLKSVEELELSVRAANCLRNANIRYIYELVQKREVDLLRMRNFGRKSLKELQGILKEMDLSLGMKLPDDLLRNLEEQVGLGEGSSFGEDR